MAKSYVDFEVTKDVSDKILESLKMAKQSGTIRKGVNEVTKSIERSLANLVVIAEDVEPEEVVMHLPQLCRQKKIPYGFVSTKEALGKAVGLTVPCASVAIEKAGEGEAAMKDAIARLTGKSTSSQAKSASPKTEAKKEEPKREQRREKEQSKETAKA